MRTILHKLDGEGSDSKPKKKVRTKNDELESILNTTHSIKNFAEPDEDLQKRQVENIERIRLGTYMIEIDAEDDDDDVEE